MTESFLQSKEWAGFQRSLGREVLEYPNLVVEPLSKEAQPPPITAKIIRHDLPFGKNYLYIPHGPVMDFNQMTGGFKNPVANFVRWLREEARKRKSMFVKAEPLVDSVAQALAEHGLALRSFWFTKTGAGFKKSKKEIQPNRTVVIDLGQSEEELLGRMRHKTRYNIGVANKHGVVVGESNDVCAFLKLLKKTAKRDRFRPHPDEYYRKLFDDNGLRTKLYFAEHDGKPIAAALVLTFGNTGYYLHGASDYGHRSLMAPYALHWHIIKMLRASGSMKYNFWGIDPRKWPGVTRFKLGWGGHTVEYPGSFDLVVSKFWYFIYKIAR